MPKGKIDRKNIKQYTAMMKRSKAEKTGRPGNRVRETGALAA